MPLVWADPAVLFCTSDDKAIYHVYKDSYLLDYWLQFEDDDSETGYLSFDIRELPEPYAMYSRRGVSWDDVTQQLREFFAQGWALGHDVKAWLRVCNVDLLEEEGQ
jgi:hypothetical protein